MREERAKLGDKLEIGGKTFEVTYVTEKPEGVLLRVDCLDSAGVVPVEIWDEAADAGRLRTPWRGTGLKRLCDCGHTWGEHDGSAACCECDCPRFQPADPLAGGLSADNADTKEEPGLVILQVITNTKAITDLIERVKALEKNSRSMQAGIRNADDRLDRKERP